VNPHTIPVRGALVPQSRALHTPGSTTAISGVSAVFQGFRPASLPTATTRDRGRLSLIATIRQEVLGVSGDPDVGQQRLQVHLVRGQGHQQRTHIRALFDLMAPNGYTDPTPTNALPLESCGTASNLPLARGRSDDTDARRAAQCDDADYAPSDCRRNPDGH
jgi:hypothetical protein